MRNSDSTHVVGIIEDVDIFRIKLTQMPLRRYLPNIEQLAQSIKEKGLLQPIVVRSSNEGYFEVVAGNRRFHACKSLGWRKIPCHIVELDYKEAFEISLIENMQRKTLNPIEEAEAFEKYISEFGWGGISDLARKINKSQEYISKRIKLLELPAEIRDQIILRRIKTSIAEELCYIKDKEEQSRLAHLIAKRHITVRKFRNIVKDVNESAVEAEMLFQPNNDRSALTALNRSILVLRHSLSKLATIIDGIEENWIIHEILMQQKNMLHSQIDLLIRQKKKLPKCSIV